MKPYYADDLVTLYHGDCRDVTEWLEADVLVTDPPYGVAIGTSSESRPGGKFGLQKARYQTYDDTYENYVATIAPAIKLGIDSTERAAVFTGPHFHELPKPDALGGIYCPSGSGRTRWGYKTFLPIMFYGQCPILKGGRGGVSYAIQSTATAEKNGHPMPKPLTWLRWLVNRVSLPGEVICDPFAGSGTTLVAAKESGFRAIGVELDEAYCEIAAKRLAQDTLFGESA